MNQQQFQFNWIDLPDIRRMRAASLQFQFSQTEKLAQDDLRRLQLHLLRALVQQSRQDVPFYRNRSYPAINSWEDWQQLPILTRRDVQQYREELRSDIDLREREGRSYPKRSSGSTGRPIEVLITDRTNLFWKAITLRDHLWQQRDFSQALAVIKQSGDDQTGPPGKRFRGWGESTGLLFKTGPSFMVSSRTDIREQYDWLRDLKPGYLLTYPSVLRELALLNLSSSEPIHFLDITTQGETLSPETRALAQQSFNCKICDLYSCQEVGYLAIQCPQTDHYHIQSETCLVEILDDQNRACRPGETGRVVVTHLHNHVMPLIRYEIGDYAVMGESCDCGIRLPVLQRILGRTRNLITYPDGSKQWPIYNMMKLVELQPNAQFQLIQKNLETLLLRIGTNNPVSEEARQAMALTINERLKSPFHVEFEIMAQIPRSKSGKFEDFISEV